jgi:hypothetical protein
VLTGTTVPVVDEPRSAPIAVSGAAGDDRKRGGHLKLVE